MKPYFEHEGIRLYCGDFREVLPSIALENGAHAIVTDPPYGETALEWDVWPSGWPALLAPHASQLWCFGSFRMFMENAAEFAPWKLAQDIVWEKHNGSGLAADRFRRVHELAAHFYRGNWKDLPLTPPIISHVETTPRAPLKRSSSPVHFEKAKNSEYLFDGTRLQPSVIRVRSCHGYAQNETQKPEGIVRPLVRYSVPPGGLVLDPFAGSGTTLAVARDLGRRAIGIERREEQCEVIARRLAQTTIPLGL